MRTRMVPCDHIGSPATVKVVHSPQQTFRVRRATWDAKISRPGESESIKVLLSASCVVVVLSGGRGSLETLVILKQAIKVPSYKSYEGILNFIRV